uniref:DNA2/NAM7 helicase-like C-terminal domain-containing protein n=1 Tax=Timema douglasi TaxID=61478 RepID=A0A7R8VDX0_TIMDO|nr:unnamed protein product [Timema douglasi]
MKVGVVSSQQESPDEQKRCDHPPPIVNKNPKPMFTTFASYETYYTTLQPLMLMELWDQLTQAQAIKQWIEVVVHARPSNSFLVYYMDQEDFINLTLYSHHELQGTKIPRTGDLVALELSLDSENSSDNGRRFTNTFGYLTATNLQTLNDHSIVICHIRPYLRVFQALENLKNSPLCNYILNPSAQDINYPKVNETLVAKDILNEAQRRTVLQLASVCRGERQGVYLIQGPPVGSRFKMVRVGTPDTIHPQVRCISLHELAKTHSQQYIKDAQDTETVQLTIAKDLGYAISMFDRLNSSLSLLPSNPVMFLNEQFRMHPEICCWPNYYFYEGRLTCAPFLHHQRITPLKPYLVLSLEYRQGLSRGHSNDGEADFVVEVASIALNTVSQLKLSVGIITPYNQQKETIQNKLREKYPGLGITCDTIDSVQGQERDVVIMSCVRTEGVGFLNDISRLNVALTRARSALYICGNFTALKV